MTTAAATDLGDHQGSERVNEYFEHHVSGLGWLLLGVAALLAALHQWTEVGELIWASVVIALIGVFIVIVGWPYFRRGHWLIHRFAHGIVMERTKGPVIAARYGDIRAGLHTYRIPADPDNAARDFVLLRLDFPDGGSYVMAELEQRSPELLVQLAECCGAGSPSWIDHEVAEKLLDDHPWQ